MREPCCDMDRRAFLRASLGSTLAWTLVGPQALGLRSAGAQERAASAEACIVLYMAGGMSQTDTFDPKPGTPQAGPLRAIRTAAREVELSEYLPRLAEQMRSVSLIRSMDTREGAHDRARYLLHTGYLPNGTVAHPDLGAQLVHAWEATDQDLPAYIGINGSGIGQGFLGVEYAPFVVNDPTRPVDDLSYAEGVTEERFDRRRRLLEAIERKFRQEHPGAETDGHLSVYTKADRLMHSPQRRVFDLSEEPQAIREAYGDHRFGQGCLMARRLVETGVKVVEVQLGGWDTHQGAFEREASLAAQLDSGFASLVGDLRERELLERTLVVCITEFGRTPVINADEGRDHFARGWSVALAGGPIRGGRVVGATTPDGARVAERPVSAQDLHATIIRALGVDAEETLYTPEGRPIQRVDESGQPIEELLRP